jgi:hypothetical protein
MKIKFFSQRSRAEQRGFTLLLAALTASIVLSLGASVYVIAKKELTLSSLGRDSQTAFYVADQAAECALYWDARYSYFGTSTPTGNGFDLTKLKCDGQCLNPNGMNCAEVNGRYTGTYRYIMAFQYSPASAGTSYCANVYVEKCDGAIGTWNPNTQTAPCVSAVPAVIHTTIHSDGFNTTCTTLNSNPRALERSVELHY